MKVLVVGTGSIGERHVRCFQATGRTDVSICEPNAELRKAVAERYGIPETFADVEAALAAKPDAAVIAVPAHLHVPLAAAAVEAGVHVLIEKPLSTGMDGVAELEASVRRRGVAVAVGYTFRAHPALAAMREAVRSGRFGDPVQIVAVSGQHYPLCRPAYRETYYRDRRVGGGAVQDALTHTINAGEWLVGPVDRLVADLDHQVLDGVEVEDTVHVLTRHGSVMGSYSLNQHQAPNELSITVIGRTGTARFEFHRNRWIWTTEPGAPWHEEPPVAPEGDARYVIQARAFLDAVERRGGPLCTLAEGICTLRVNLAILASAERRAWQEVSDRK